MTIEMIPVLEAAGAAILALIALGVGLGIRWIYSKTQSSLVDRALTAVSQACHLAVTQTWSCYVEGLKIASTDGTLTTEEKATARERAITLAKGFLGAKGLALIVKGLGIESAWLDSFLGSAIESSLTELRRAERSSWAGLGTSFDPTAGVAPAELASDPMPASAAD